MKTSKIIAIALAAAITVSPFAGVVSSTNVSANESSAKIAANKAEMKTQLAQLVEEEQAVSAKLKADQATFKNLRADQAKLEKSMKETEAAIAKRKAKLDERARSMQTSNTSSSIVEAIFEADSITDAAASVMAYSKFQNADVSIVKAQEKDEKKLVANNKALSAKVNSQRSIIAANEVAAGKLAAQKAEKEVLVARLADDEAAAKKAEKAAVALAAAAKVEPIKAVETAKVDTTKDAEEKVKTVAVQDETTATVTPSKTPSQPAKEEATNAGSVQSGVAGAIQEAYKYAGQAYGGGAVPGNFDCSGLVMWSYAKAGISLPRTAAAQYGATTRISESQAQAGDLVFFSDGGISHVGIYLGGGQMFNSQNNGIQTDNIHGAYWGEHLAGFGRIN